MQGYLHIPVLTIGITTEYRRKPLKKSLAWVWTEKDNIQKRLRLINNLWYNYIVFTMILDNSCWELRSIRCNCNGKTRRIGRERGTKTKTSFWRKIPFLPKIVSCKRCKRVGVGGLCCRWGARQLKMKLGEKWEVLFHHFFNFLTQIFKKSRKATQKSEKQEKKRKKRTRFLERYLSWPSISGCSLCFVCCFCFFLH